MDPDKITEAPPESTEDAVLAAMDAGIEAAAEAEPEAAPAAAQEPAADEPTPEAVDQPKEGEQPKPEGEAKPDEPKPEDKAKEPDKAVEEEITALGLKEKSAARFRELSAEVATFAPIKETLAQAGIKPEELPSVVKAAKDFEGWVGQVLDTGATPEQYGQTLDYLRLVNSDPEKAYELALGEVQNLAKLLGKELPGVHDPLAAHADLQQAVEAGDITRKHALEVAQARQREVLVKQGQEAAQQRQQAQQAEQQQAQAAEAGRQGLNALGAELSAADPTGYAAKVELLKPILGYIKSTLPPDKWVQATRDAYAKLPTPAAAPAPSTRPAPGHVPLRPTGARQNLQPAAFDNMEDALEAGIAAAGG